MIRLKSKNWKYHKSVADFYQYLKNEPLHSELDPSFNDCDIKTEIKDITDIKNKHYHAQDKNFIVRCFCPKHNDRLYLYRLYVNEP